MSVLSPIGDSQWPWSVSIPGLTADGAQLVTDAVAARRPDVQVIQIDPRDFLSLQLDRATVKELIEALSSVTDLPSAGGFREILEEWLEFAGEEEDEE